MKIRRLLSLWAYGVEVIAASAFLVALVLYFGAESVAAVIETAGGTFASHFAVVMFGASLAMTWTYFSKSDTNFAGWLQQKEAFLVYAAAFVTSASIYGALILILILSLYTEAIWIDLVAGWFAILGAINVYTVLKNVYGLMQLMAEFNRQQQMRKK